MKWWEETITGWLWIAVYIWIVTISHTLKDMLPYFVKHKHTSEAVLTVWNWYFICLPYSQITTSNPLSRFISSFLRISCLAIWIVFLFFFHISVSLTQKPYIPLSFADSERKCTLGLSQGIMWVGLLNHTLQSLNSEILHSKKQKALVMWRGPLLENSIL